MPTRAMIAKKIALGAGAGRARRIIAANVTQTRAMIVKKIALGAGAVERRRIAVANAEAMVCVTRAARAGVRLVTVDGMGDENQTTTNRAVAT